MTTNEAFDDAAELARLVQKMLSVPSPFADQLLALLIDKYGAEGMNQRCPGWMEVGPGIQRTAALLYSATHLLHQREWGTDMGGIAAVALKLRAELHDQFVSVGIDPAKIPAFMGAKG